MTKKTTLTPRELTADEVLEFVEGSGVDEYLTVPGFGEVPKGVMAKACGVSLEEVGALPWSEYEALAEKTRKVNKAFFDRLARLPEILAGRLEHLGGQSPPSPGQDTGQES